MSLIPSKEGNVIRFGHDIAITKAKRIAYLSEICEQEICKGFISSVNGHHYKTDRDDQINFIGQKDVLSDNPQIESLFWKTQDAGYVEITRAEFFTIYQEGFMHKDRLIRKFGTLRNSVNLASSKAEIESVVWDENGV
ncbi:DUF4376 domain-containing protein [Marinicrinis sediminis]|uniref:DUF4376 domain-containing protein n=1 Tax=Marinicrinis sediminis TaxID=1652465 RepID=A0ABW5R9T1_9BACL